VSYRLSPDIIERILQDKRFWRKLAIDTLREGMQNRTLSVDSTTARAPSLGPVIESRLLGRDPRLRLRGRQRPIPMIAEVRTIDESGVLLSQNQARRVKRSWDRARVRGQKLAQNIDANPDREDPSDGMDDHTGQSCSDVHPNMSHADWMDSEEEGENMNPLFRDPALTSHLERRGRR
jgi:hypothetical protein